MIAFLRLLAALFIGGLVFNATAGPTPALRVDEL